jgi:hypothetical protein
VVSLGLFVAVVAVVAVAVVVLSQRYYYYPSIETIEIIV